MAIEQFKKLGLSPEEQALAESRAEYRDTAVEFTTAPGIIDTREKMQKVLNSGRNPIITPDGAYYTKDSNLAGKALMLVQHTDLTNPSTYKAASQKIGDVREKVKGLNLFRSASDEVTPKAA
jgi:hypothetical protein